MRNIDKMGRRRLLVEILRRKISKIGMLMVRYQIACITVALNSGPAHAQELGTQELRDVCNTVVDVIVPLHERFENGLTLDRFRKELQIELAGKDEQDDAAASTFYIGAAIAENYVKNGRSADDLRIDYLLDVFGWRWTLT